MGKKSDKQKGGKTTGAKARKEKSLPWRGMLIAGILAMIIYGPSYNHGWTLDDASAIEENVVTQKGLAGIGTHLTHSYRYGYWSAKGTLYRPISLVMFSIEWALSPDNPKLHHGVNILLYGLLCALLFLLLFAIIKSEFWALLISLLFLAHPVHVEVVANIKSRDEILATLFGIAALLSWWKYLGGKKLRNLILGILLYGLALFSKESTITLLAVFPALAFLFFRNNFSKDWIKSLLFLIPAVLYLMARVAVLGSVGEGSGEASPLDNFLFASDDWLLRKASACLILGKYLWTLIVPFSLGSDYGYNQIPIVGFGDWRVLLALVAHLGLVYLLIKNWKQKPLLTFGIFFYLATISIFSNVLIEIGSSYGERFLFLPSIGFILFLVSGLKLYSERKGIQIQDFAWNKTTQFPILIVSLFLLFYSFKTLERIPAWKNSLTLYQTDILNAPNSAKLNYHYALECAKMAKDIEDAKLKNNYNGIAKKHFEQAINIYPKYVDAYGQLGLLYYRLGDAKRVMEMYNKGIQAKPPGKALIYSNMGIIYFNSGQLDQAEAVYKKALELDSRFVDAYQNLGAVYASQKLFDQAIPNFRKGLELKPNSEVLNFYLGSALKDSGNAAAAAPYFARAQELKARQQK